MTEQNNKSYYNVFLIKMCYIKLVENGFTNYFEIKADYPIAGFDWEFLYYPSNDKKFRRYI
jgi:hypothetical protein